MLQLWHYGTRMLCWRKSQRYGLELIDCSTGWGSVSDQNGMNTAFRELGLPYRFDRDQRGGGPRHGACVRRRSRLLRPRGGRPMTRFQVSDRVEYFHSFFNRRFDATVVKVSARAVVIHLDHPPAGVQRVRRFTHLQADELLMETAR